MKTVEGNAEPTWAEVSEAHPTNDHVDCSESTSKMTLGKSSGLQLEASEELCVKSIIAHARPQKSV
jgi:hypothetical protein